MTLGQDYTWWFLPTTPLLRINYFERMFTVKDLQKKRVFEQDDSDPEKKIFAQLKSSVDKEKKIIKIAFVISLATWFFLLRNNMNRWLFNSQL